MRRDRKLLCEKRVMVKADIARSISKETIRRVIQKSEQPEMNLFLVKRNPDQK